MPVPTIQWKENHVRILDQTKLPLEKTFLKIGTKEEMWEAIKMLKVRGAPAIGIAAAFGVYLGVRDFRGNDREEFVLRLNEVCSYVESSRPTAVNLFWAVSRVKKTVEKHPELGPEVIYQLEVFIPHTFGLLTSTTNCRNHSGKRNQAGEWD